MANELAPEDVSDDPEALGEDAPELDPSELEESSSEVPVADEPPLVLDGVESLSEPLSELLLPELPEPLEKNWSDMHFCWHSAYLSVSAAVPFPCGQSPMHSVVAFTMSSVGAGLPKHSATHDKLLPQSSTHFCCSGV